MVNSFACRNELHPTPADEMQPREYRHSTLLGWDGFHARILVCSPSVIPVYIVLSILERLKLLWKHSTNICDCFWTTPFPSFICSCLIFLLFHADSKTLLTSAELKSSSWGCQHLSYQHHNPKASQSLSGVLNMHAGSLMGAESFYSSPPEELVPASVLNCLCS